MTLDRMTFTEISEPHSECSCKFEKNNKNNILGDFMRPFPLFFVIYYIKISLKKRQSYVYNVDNNLKYIII
jgi:hypothetical protein